jgi:hypothetical protein
MQSRSFSFITFTGVLILAIACSGDDPTGPDAPSQIKLQALRSLRRSIRTVPVRREVQSRVISKA